ncbi:hypothetical protein DH2020_007075 [Rehmannia glutinosa]|uniref:Histone-lysine N-methyltransferase n=1 Tax=Rehmannia glutinosa TaxID=99300 RepID=A0ABR0TXZ0_REHGL
MDELQNALNNKSLTISTFPEKGRCLFTTRDFSPGEVIISESPYVSVPNKNKESPESKCEWCFSSTNLKKCSACHVVWYCSSTCQKSDWKLHCVECQALKKVDKERLKSITPSIRLMVRLCIRRKLENQKMANLVNLILQWPDSEINIKEIAEIFSKLACNAHTICDSELRPLGTGLYPVISIINHGCLPNSVLVFERRLAVVRAMQHIPKGTEVLISYIEIAGSTITRQKALKEQYFFSCACSRCIKLKVIDARIANVMDFSFVTLMIKELQMKLYHPFSVNLMRTRETLLKILMELQDWKEALSYCRLTIPIYERVYPRCHPLIGLQYYTCGKLEWLLGETEAAVKSLTKALDILRITHGTKTPFMLELLSKLEEARAEASYMLRSQNED